LIEKSPYEVLGLEGDFEFKDIKKAYRKAIRANPPEQKPEAFAEISGAYEMLSNEEYFEKDAKDKLYTLSIELKIADSTKADKSQYLKNIFEVPFLI